MATRTINTKLSLDGDAEYKAGLKSINSEMSTLNSELKLIESTYKGQENTVQALAEKSNILSQQYNKQSEKVEMMSQQLSKAKDAEAEYQNKVDDINQTLQEKTSALEKLKASSEDTTEEEKKLQEEINKLNEELEKNEEKASKAANSVNAYQRDLNYAEIKLNDTKESLDANNKALNEAKDSSDGCAKSMNEFGEENEKTGTFSEKLSNILSSNLVLSLGTVVDFAKMVGKGIYDLAVEIDEAQGIIVKGTGATGASLSELTDNMMNVMSMTEDTMTDVATAIADVNTRLKLQGEELENVTLLMLEYADVNNSDVSSSIENVSKLTKKWNVDTKDMNLLLDELTAASQATGMSVDEMTGYLVSNFAQFSQLGYSLNDAIALLAMFEDKGANVSQVMTGMRQAITHLSEETDDISGGFKDLISRISNATSEAEGLNIATEYFGSRAGQEMYYAIKDCGWALEDYIDILEKAGGTLEESDAEADTWSDAWTQFFNELKNVGYDAFDALSGGTMSYNDNLEELTATSKKFAAATDEAKTATESSNEKTTATADVAKKYVARLQELETAGLKTAESQDEYALVVDQLGSLLPELSLTINEQTGLLDQNTNSILANIDAWEQQSYNQAVYDNYQEALSLYNQTLVDVQTKEKQLSDIDAQQDVIAGQLAQKRKKLAEAYGIEENHVDSLGSSAKEYNEISGYTREEVRAMWNDLADLEDQQEDNDEQARLLNDAIAEENDTLSEYQDQVNGACGLVNDLTDSQRTNLQIVQENTDLTNAEATEYMLLVNKLQGYEAELDNLETSYIEAKTTALDSLQSQYDLMDNVTQMSAVSVEDLIGNLQSQQEAFLAYSSNLAWAAEHGLSEDLLAVLSVYSEEHAAILQGIVDDGGAHIEELDSTFSGLAGVEETTSNTMADVQTNFSEGFDEVTRKAEIAEIELNTKFAKAMDQLNGVATDAVDSLDQSDKTFIYAQNDVQGMIDGINSKKQQLYNAFAELAKYGNKGYTDHNEQKSPSKRYKRVGAFDVDGVIQGVQSKEKELYDQMSKVAAVGFEGYEIKAKEINEQTEKALVYESRPMPSVSAEPSYADSSAAVVNAISTLVVGQQQSAGAGGTSELVININGVTLARSSLDDFIAVAKQRGKVINI